VGPATRNTTPPCLHPVAIAGDELHFQRRVDAGEDLRGDVKPADDKVMTGGDEGARAVAGAEDRAARHIAESGVFLQREVDQVVGAGIGHGKKKG
jgi:hypothetical protein